jgi:hypothetical protein
MITKPILRRLLRRAIDRQLFRSTVAAFTGMMYYSDDRSTTTQETFFQYIKSGHSKLKARMDSIFNDVYKLSAPKASYNRVTLRIE